MKEQTFTVSSPADFRSVIEYILEQVVKAPPASQFTTPTTPTPPSVNHEAGGATVITLTGDLGAGKTTFTQELAKYLGVTEPVVSPTFMVMRAYELEGNNHFDQLIHIDAYRFDDVSEAGPIRLTELFTQLRTLICLEWPERIAEILPKEKIDVQISIQDGETREVVVSM